MFNLLKEVKEKNPLVIQYTNNVTVNDCANITLAIGGSPFMGSSLEEVEQAVSIASSVVINIGTMSLEHEEIFIRVGKACNKFNKPVVLDPVGVFATKVRAEFVERILKEVKFDVIKGNVAEIKYLGGHGVNGKGVDSFDNGEDIGEIVKEISNRLGSVIAATGKVDTISDGKRIARIRNGEQKLQDVTGAGCMTASLVGSFIGACEDKFEATTMGVLSMGLSGELANENNPSIGTYKVRLMDAIYELNEEIYTKHAKLEVI